MQMHTHDKVFVHFSSYKSSELARCVRLEQLDAQTLKRTFWPRGSP